MGRLPKQINYMSDVYKVKVGGTGISSVSGNKFLGVVNETEGTIRIRKDLALQIEQSTLLHETVHLMLGLTDDESQEGIVNKLTRQLLHLIKENPDLIMYLWEA